MGEYRKSKLIKERRKAAGLTQEKLAEEICDTVTLSRYESGITDPTRDKYYQLMYKLKEQEELCLFPVICESIETAGQMEKITYAMQQQDIELVQSLKEELQNKYMLSLKYPENRQYLKRIDTLLKHWSGEIDSKAVIKELRIAWEYTYPQYTPENFPLHKILRETEIIILFNLATYYKKVKNYEKSLTLYKRLDQYFNREDMIHVFKPFHLVYLGYSNLLGQMKRYEESLEICKKAIAKLLRENLENYLYHFFYIMAWNIVNLTGVKEEAKLYVWLAYQLCNGYPEDKKNLEKAKGLYHRCIKAEDTVKGDPFNHT